MRRLLSLICLVLCLVLTANAELTAYFLDVGQADATVIICDGQVLMIDGGNRGDSQFIYSWLTNTMGISSIDMLISSHPHEDHVGGLAAALNACTVGEVYTAVTAYDSKCFRSFIKYCGLQGVEPQIPAAGSTHTLGGAVVTFLTSPQSGDSANDQSLVVRVDYNDISFLFTGDMEYEAERRLLESGFCVDVDVLKVAHHGSASSSSMALLRAVSPRVSIISVGAKNSYGHPAESVLRRLHETGCAVLRTDECGTIVITTDGRSIACTSERNDVRVAVAAK